MTARARAANTTLAAGRPSRVVRRSPGVDSSGPWHWIGSWNVRVEQAFERWFMSALGGPPDTDDFAAYSRRMTARMWSLFGLACIPLNLAAWILDPWIFRTDHRSWAVFTVWRLGFLACAVGTYWSMRRTAERNASPYLVASGVQLGFTCFSFLLFSAMGGADRPWMQTGAVYPLATVLFAVPLLPRLGLALGTAVVVLASCFFPHPDYLQQPYALSLVPLTIGCALLGTGGGHAFYVLIRRNFEQRRELARLAYVDVLTNASSRARFLELAEIEIGRARRYRRPLSLLILDIDHFKQINDTHGHAVGDLVLRAVADSVKRTIRGIDLFGRIGGEEFGVVLPETGAVQAAALAERLRLAAAEATVNVPYTPLTARCTITVGGAELRMEREQLRELLVRADTALYEGKRAGRNRVVLA